MKNLIKDTLIDATIVYLLVFAPSLVLGIRNLFMANNTPVYKTNIELQKDLEEEKKKLKLEEVVIDAKFGKHGKRFLGMPIDSGTYAKNIGDRKYELVLGDIRNKTGLKHEIFHIYEMETGKVPKKPWKWEYWGSEWRAQNYAAKN